jgi:nucleoside-diphosphate-sugar epimerase
MSRAVYWKATGAESRRESVRGPRGPGILTGRVARPESAKGVRTRVIELHHALRGLRACHSSVMFHCLRQTPRIPFRADFSPDEAGRQGDSVDSTIMANVLVTGGCGFIGSHLIRRLLSQGDQVTCLDRAGSSLEQIRDLPLTIVHGDVTDEAAVHKAVAGKSVVYHVAGCLFPAHSRDFYRINAEGTAAVARACAEQARPPVLVSISSLAAAGPCLNGRPRREIDPPRPVSHYGRSKRAGELALQECAHRIPATIVRPPAVFGEGDLTGLSMFRPIARLGVFAYTVWPTVAISLIHVHDLVTLLTLAAERGSRLPADCANQAVPERGVYYASSDEHLIGVQWGETIARSLGRKRVMNVPVPAPTLWLVAAACQFYALISRRAPAFSWDRARPAAAGRWLCSAQLAADELGFRPAASLNDRLRQTADWYCEKGWL